MEKEKKGIRKKGKRKKKEKDKADVGKREMEEAGTEFPVGKGKGKGKKEAFWLPFVILFFLRMFLSLFCDS